MKIRILLLFRLNSDWIADLNVLFQVCFRVRRIIHIYFQFFSFLSPCTIQKKECLLRDWSSLCTHLNINLVIKSISIIYLWLSGCAPFRINEWFYRYQNYSNIQDDSSDFRLFIDVKWLFCNNVIQSNRLQMNLLLKHWFAIEQDKSIHCKQVQRPNATSLDDDEFEHFNCSGSRLSSLKQIIFC